MRQGEAHATGVWFDTDQVYWAAFAMYSVSCVQGSVISKGKKASERYTSTVHNRLLRKKALGGDV